MFDSVQISTGKLNFISVGSKFRQQLEVLMEKLKSTVSYKNKTKWILNKNNATKWAAPWKMCLWAWGQWKPWSDCTSVQSDQGLHYPLTKSLNTTECMNGEQKPGWCSAHWLADLNLCNLCMFSGTFFAWHGLYGLHHAWRYLQIICLQQGHYQFTKALDTAEFIGQLHRPWRECGWEGWLKLEKCISVNGDSSFEKVK